VLLPLTLGQSSPGGCGATATVPNPDSNSGPDESLNETIVDSDGDGFSDDAEINGTPGTEPNDPTDNPNHVRDSDGDGCSDYDELNFDGFCNNDPNVPAQTTEDFQAATWLVVAISDYSLATATAFGIAPRLLGTNAHVVESIVATWGEPNASAWVFQHETGEVREITTVWAHPDYDIGSQIQTPDVGILEVDTTIPSFLTIPDSNSYPAVEVFEPVGLCGFPGSVTLGVDFVGLSTGDFHPRATCLDGSISAIRPFDPGDSLTSANAQLIQYDISTEPGVSGSAVFNASGEIVGVHALGAGESSEQNFAIRIDKLAELLAWISDGNVVGRPVP
jgi:V8-like Glu-specific endopeptidase